jgi:hypothetical protein
MFVLASYARKTLFKRDKIMISPCRNISGRMYFKQIKRLES